MTVETVITYTSEPARMPQCCGVSKWSSPVSSGL